MNEQMTKSHQACIMKGIFNPCVRYISPLMGVKSRQNARIPKIKPPMSVAIAAA